MTKRKNRETDSFTVSFLDVASCGFGAMIILLMITKSSAPTTLEIVETITPEGSVAELQDQLFQIRGETAVINRELNAKQEQLSANKERLARLQRDLEDVQGRFNTTKDLSDETTDEMGRLAIAQQTLTEEMQRLLANTSAPDNNVIGGVPVDSEYIIFVIDTSGSMFQGPWNLVIEKVSETLAVYPEIKGIQVLNDEGDYMFSSYAGKWIPDSSEIRRNITRTLRFWNPPSDSSPVEGITEAINTFYTPDRKISIYVFGDDFSRGSVEAVCRYVAQINKADRFGNRLVRIHGIGFPTQTGTSNGAKFANLMRKLSEQNGGTFVALPTL